MTSNRALLTAVFALGLASAAQAQPDTSAAPAQPAAPAPASSAATTKPGSVEGVTVVAPPAPPEDSNISAEKKKALADEAAQNEAWRRYRESTPRLTRDPNDQSKDFPGLQSYVPK